MRWLGPAATLLGIGWFFAFCILIGLLGGRWLDGTLQTFPIFTLIGIVVGLTLALVGGLRLLLRVLKMDTSSTNSEEK